MKLGGIFRKIKGVFNLSAGVQGSATGRSLGDAEAKLHNAIARHTGYSQPHGDWNIDRALPTYQAIATEGLIQYIDGKTRHYGNISRKKLLDIAEEAVPIIQAYSAGGDMAQMANQYHMNTQGYQMSSIWGDYNASRTKAYLTVKGIRILGNMSGLVPWLNKRLPKGVNL
jgi:hypothetical protein